MYDLLLQESIWNAMVSADGHLGCFHVLAIINSAAMNIGVHVTLSILCFSRHTEHRPQLSHPSRLRAPQGHALWDSRAEGWSCQVRTSCPGAWPFPEEKGMTEDEMAGGHHQLDGHEFE